MHSLRIGESHRISLVMSMIDVTSCVYQRLGVHRKFCKRNTEEPGAFQSQATGSEPQIARDPEPPSSLSLATDVRKWLEIHAIGLTTLIHAVLRMRGGISHNLAQRQLILLQLSTAEV